MVIEAGVNLVCRGEAFWLTESDWCFKKVFHTVFDVLVTHEVFCPYQCFLLKEREMLYSSITTGNFFFQAAIIFATTFCGLVHRKTFVLPTDCCFWKKRLKIESGKKTKSLAAKKSRISEDFLDLSTENRKFRRYCILSLFGQWNQSKEFPNQLALSGSKVHPHKRNIKDRQRICFLFVDWANWKFFFCGRKVSCLICFFLPLKERF